MSKWRVGIDIGGTFTDFVAIDDAVVVLLELGEFGVEAQSRLRLPLGLEPLVLGVEQPFLVLRAVELGEQPARLVRDAHEVEAAEQQREHQQHQYR